MSEEEEDSGLYRSEFAAQAKKVCRLGATNEELADFFGVSSRTIKNWFVRHPKFGEAVKRGKMAADAEVANKLYQNAKGYKHLAFKMFCHEGRVVTKRYVEHYQPNTTAQIFWLKNRRPDLWRDRHEFTGKDGKDLPATVPDVMEVARSIAWVLASAERKVDEAAGEVKH